MWSIRQRSRFGGMTTAALFALLYIALLLLTVTFPSTADEIVEMATSAAEPQTCESETCMETPVPTEKKPEIKQPPVTLAYEDNEEEEEDEEIEDGDGDDDDNDGDSGAAEPQISYANNEEDEEGKEDDDTDDEVEECSDKMIESCPECCAKWEKDGECDSDPLYMLQKCQKTCLACSRSIDTFDAGHDQTVEGEVFERIATLKIIRAYNIFLLDFVPNLVSYDVHDLCRNDHDLCAFWASTGECESNPGFMGERCALACWYCHDLKAPEFYEYDTGVEQIVKGTPEETRQILEELTQAASYLRSLEIKDCGNTEQLCSYWAAMGECEINEELPSRCPLACRACHVASSGIDSS